MTCVICKHGETKAGHANVTLQKETCTVIFKGVPAEVCDNCGEYYLTEDIARDLLKRADTAAHSGTEIEIIAYAA